MTNSDFIWRDATVAIVGLGLMGGSLALGLQEKQACRKIIGVARNPNTRQQASAKGIQATDDLNAVSSADVIVLATPVRTIIEQLPRVAQVAHEGAIIFDMGSTKREIVHAMEILPPHVQPIGAHPMCGKEKAGFDAADAQLYRDAVFVLTPLARTTTRAIECVTSLALLLGARPVVLDAERHDKIVAAISHLPFVVATALMSTANKLADGDDSFFTLAAGGFRDTSRLAASDTTMLLDILLTNRENIVNALRRYSAQLDELSALIDQANPSQLHARLSHIAETRRGLVRKSS